MPAGMEEPAEPADLTLEQYQKQRELGRRLGERGWLWPTAPQVYGGGGLEIDDAIIIEEEMDTRGLYLPPYYDSGGRLGGNTVLVWGSEEQKLRLLPPILRGEVRTWQLLSEPEAGSRFGRCSYQRRQGWRPLRYQWPEDIHRQPPRS